MRWYIVTGEYPPQSGGVSDYTRLVARGLAEAGDEVRVWAPECPGPTPTDSGVQVHRLPGHFGPRALCQLDRALRRQRGCFRVLVQYVPHMYGWKAMNVPFCLWLWARCRPSPWVMFHEVAFPCAWGQSLRHHFLGVVTHAMAALVARAAERLFVSVPWWVSRLRRLAPRQRGVVWLPVPSNFGTDPDSEAVAAVRRQRFPDPGTVVIGHFGTFSDFTANQLAAVLPVLLGADGRRHFLLVGQGSEALGEYLRRAHPDLASRTHVTGCLSGEAVAAHLRASDLLIQPYRDGVSSRRTSLMSGLALGLPVVTTHGPATEPVWDREQLVALAPAGQPEALAGVAEGLLKDAAARQRLGDQGRDGYQNHFSLTRTIATLRRLATADSSGTRSPRIVARRETRA